MKTLPQLVLVTGLITVLCAAASQAEKAAVSVAVTQLRGPLHLLQAVGGNVVASVGGDGVLLVDDDYATNAAALETAVSGLAQSSQAPRFVLNTHWHNDHTGGNQHWGSRGSVILAHANVRGRMSSRQNVKALGMVVEPSPAEALPVVTFEDSMALHFNGVDIEVQHYPGGHTDGDSVIYFSQQNVVHMGDLFFKDRFPFVDVSSGGGVVAYTANVATVLARIDDKTIVVPGHGSVANKADLQRFHRMLGITISRVKSALAAGETVEAIVAQGLGAEWSAWGKGFINEAAWINSIAASP